jgi:DNA-binding PadR family transcriptional regulator
MPSKPLDADFFGTFLTSVGEAGEHTSQGAELQKQLMQRLDTDGGRSSVRSLFGEFSLPPSVVMGALKELEQAGIITISAAGTDDRVELTPLGRTVAS